VDEKNPVETPGSDDGVHSPLTHTHSMPSLEEHHQKSYPGRGWSAPLIISQPSPQPDEPSFVWKQQFGDRPVITWRDFGRFIVAHFAEVTRIEYRPLSSMDLQIIKEKLETDNRVDVKTRRFSSLNDTHGPTDKVTLQAFTQMWPWFRSLEDTINQIQNDWCKDNPKVINGILSRGHTEDLLRTSPVGTFLLRFSENYKNLGVLALAYVEENKSITHTLLDVKNGVFEMKTKSQISITFNSLSELVLTCKPLRTLYPNTDKTRVFQENDDDDYPH